MLSHKGNRTEFRFTFWVRPLRGVSHARVPPGCVTPNDCAFFASQSLLRSKPGLDIPVQAFAAPIPLLTPASPFGPGRTSVYVRSAGKRSTGPFPYPPHPRNRPAIPRGCALPGDTTTLLIPRPTAVSRFKGAGGARAEGQAETPPRVLTAAGLVRKPDARNRPGSRRAGATLDARRLGDCPGQIPVGYLPPV